MYSCCMRGYVQRCGKIVKLKFFACIAHLNIEHWTFVTAPNVTTRSEVESNFFFVLDRKATVTTIEPHNLMMNKSTLIRQQTTTTPCTSAKETGQNMQKSTDRTTTRTAQHDIAYKPKDNIHYPDTMTSKDGH